MHLSLRTSYIPFSFSGCPPLYQTREPFRQQRFRRRKTPHHHGSIRLNAGPERDGDIVVGEIHCVSRDSEEVEADYGEGADAAK